MMNFLTSVFIILAALMSEGALAKNKGPMAKCRANLGSISMFGDRIEWEGVTDNSMYFGAGFGSERGSQPVLEIRNPAAPLFVFVTATTNIYLDTSIRKIVSLKHVSSEVADPTGENNCEIDYSYSIKTR
jgi:hypothetical protein